MLKIYKSSNGKKKKAEVSRQAYDNFFKNAGWHIVGGTTESKQPVKVADESGPNKYEEPESVSEEEEYPDGDDWDKIDEDYEKPLSEMNRSELVEKAKSINLDISDCTSNKQIREKIKSNM